MVRRASDNPHNGAGVAFNSILSLVEPEGPRVGDVRLKFPVVVDEPSFIRKIECQGVSRASQDVEAVVVVVTKIHPVGILADKAAGEVGVCACHFNICRQVSSH